MFSKKSLNLLPGLVLLGLTIFADLAFVRLKTYETGSAAKRIGTEVHLLAFPIQGMCPNLGYQSKGHHIMCLLDDVVLWVQAPCNEPLQEVAARSFCGGAGS